MISRASEWWLIHADAHGPQHRACRELAAIISAALDSAKTGRLKALPSSLKVGRRDGRAVLVRGPCARPHGPSPAVWCHVSPKAASPPT